MKIIKWGFNLRATMVDKDVNIAASQNSSLWNAGGRCIYYADLDEEFNQDGWFGPDNGLDYRKRLYNWWIGRGGTVYHPLVNSNVGVESSVPASVWQTYLSARGGWTTMARKDIISAIIRTKYQPGWQWLLNDIAAQKAIYAGMNLKGVIGPDVFLFFTDAWSSSAPTSWSRLTNEGKTKVEMLGSIVTSTNPFMDFATAARNVWGTTVVSDACFIYDHGNGIRVESMYGAPTKSVIEFGVSRACSNRPLALTNMFNYLRHLAPDFAMLHTPIDPSLAWYWKNNGGTQSLWDATLYPGTGGAHEFTTWPFTDMQSVIKTQMPNRFSF